MEYTPMRDTLEFWQKFQDNVGVYDLNAIYDHYYPYDNDKWKADSPDDKARKYLSNVMIIRPIKSRQVAACALAMAEYIRST